MKIPYDGPTGSGVLRTGPLKIGDDWTGIFIRGDEAMTKADLLEHTAMHYQMPKDSFCYRLAALLRSCKE